MANGLTSLDLMDLLIILITFILGILAAWYIVPWLKKSWRFRTFRDVFGNVAVKHENLVISLPLWHLMRAPRDATRFIKETFDVAKADEWYGPDKLIDFDNLEAGLRINSLLFEFYPQPVPFTLDNHTPLNEIGVQQTIFIIGPPNANLLTKTLFNTQKEDNTLRFEYIEHPKGVGYESELSILDKQDNEIYDSTGNWEYSMILRVPNITHDGYFFLISGCNNSGTLSAVNFLKTNWHKFQGAEQRTAGVLLRADKTELTSDKDLIPHEVKSYGIKTSLSSKLDEAAYQLINDWKEYIERISPQIAQERHKYIYPIEERITADREFRQDRAKVLSEKAEISKLLTTDWQIAIDFGCGPGMQFHLFDQESKERCFLIGIDPDYSRANLAQITASKILKWTESKIVCGGIEILENAPSELQVDRILCAQVLGHVSEEQLIRILKGFHRVLDPDGSCAILIPVIGETFKEHPYHAKGWDGASDYTHVVNTNLSPDVQEFRRYVSLKEYTHHANHPEKDMLPVHSYLLPEFPDPKTFKTPGKVNSIPPTIERIIKNDFEAEEIVLYSIHRDTPESNWPVADVILFLRKS